MYATREYTTVQDSGQTVKHNAFNHHKWLSQPPSQFRKLSEKSIWSHWQYTDGGLHLYSHAGNKGSWAFTVYCSGINVTKRQLYSVTGKNPVTSKLELTEKLERPTTVPYVLISAFKLNIRRRSNWILTYFIFN